MTYDYRRKYKDNYDYRSDLRKDYGHDNKYKYDDPYLSYADDYTTSAMSYDDYRKKTRPTSPHSKSEEYSYDTRNSDDYDYDRGRHRTRGSHRHRSPIEDYDDFNKDELIKKRSKKTRKDMQNVFYQFEIERSKHKNNDRKSRSPRRREDYDDYIVEEPDENLDYHRYFEKTRIKDKGEPKKYAKDDLAIEDGKRSIKRNDYHVFAYKEPKKHDRVFRSREKDRQRSPASSEIEIGNIDYPVLAFKNNSPKNKSSSLIYLPLVFREEISKSQEKTKHKDQLNQEMQNQVFAANVSGNKNIFTVKDNNKNKENLKNKAVLELQTEELVTSDATNTNDNSDRKNSIETQTDESSTFEHNHPNTQSYKKTGTVLSSVLKEEKLGSKSKDDSSSKGSRSNEHLLKTKKILTYDIDVAFEPIVKRNVFLSTAMTKNDPIHLIEYKHIKDPLRDDYPVTKDYIKVSDNSSTKMEDSLIKTTPLTRNSNEAKISTNVKYNIIKDKNAEKGSTSGTKTYKESNDSRNQSIIHKISRDKLLGNEQDSMMSRLKPPDYIKIYRSTVSNAFKKSITQRPSTSQPDQQLISSARKSMVDDNKSTLSINEIMQPSEGEQEIKNERMSLAMQTGPPLVGTKSQSNIRESRVEKPNRDSKLNEPRKSKSILRPPRFSRSNDQSAIKSIDKTNKPIESDVSDYQEGSLINTDNVGQRDDKRSSLSNLSEYHTRKSEVPIKDKSSKTKLSRLFSRSKSRIKSEDKQGTRRRSAQNASEIENYNDYERKSAISQSRKSGIQENERKSAVSQSRKSDIKERQSKSKFSGLFSKKNKSMSGSTTKLTSPGKSATSSQDTLIEKESGQDKSLEKTPSQVSRTRRSRRGQSKSLEKTPSQVSKTNNGSKVWSFLKRAKSKDKKEKRSTTSKPAAPQQELSETPGEIPSDTNYEQRKKQESLDKVESSNKANEEDGKCECVIKYVKQVRECGHFFLGTTLHEQIMEILKIL